MNYRNFPILALKFNPYHTANTMCFIHSFCPPLSFFLFTMFQWGFSITLYKVTMKQGDKYDVLNAMHRQGSKIVSGENRGSSSAKYEMNSGIE